MGLDKFVSIAETEVGYLEKKTNSQLNDKTANAGYNNFTKYGAWYGWNGVAWCAQFVSWCADQDGLINIVCPGTHQLAGKGFAYCPYFVTAFKNAGQWKTSNPQKGDIIFFQSSGVASHVGIVYKVSGSIVYTVEGNTSSTTGVVANGGGVFKKSYTIGSSYILGYGRPNYVVTPDSNGCPYGTGTSLIKKGSTGTDVFRLQWYLTEYGYNTNGIDGQFGNATDVAVRSFQSKYKLTVDGEVGTNTWNWLVNNYKTDVKGEMTVSQYTELKQEIQDLKSMINELTKEYDYQVSTIYTNLDVIKTKADWAYEASKWAVDTGVWVGTDKQGTLNKSLLDLKSIVELYRAKDI